MNASEIDLGDLNSEDDIELALSNPTPGLVETMSRVEGDILVLGVGGKMGPSLAMMARKACNAAGISKRIIGVARFSNPDVAARLHSAGVETIQGDLLDHAFLRSLPDAPNIIYMAGMKFGSTGNEGLTWAMNCYLPGMICERFPTSRIVAFSTGNVYSMTPVSGCGSRETDPPAPVGDYAMSCLGRERVFQHFSEALSIPVLLFRLNYAVEFRYGVLVDLATSVWNREPVDLTTGFFNVIWQPDANAMALQSLEHTGSPAAILNVTGPDVTPVREVCIHYGEIMNREVQFTGTESERAFLNNSAKAFKLFGEPSTTVDEMIDLVAQWVMRDGISHGKPTHFETRDGKF
jgi:nucleoside-diphosphate-sugar epimerase